MKRLPPLTAIEAFVETARAGSVRSAAEALSLSSPALSRRLQVLEHHVGHRLFERGHQALRLNAEGERLFGALAPALDQLALALERASGEEEIMRLRLSVPPLFASYQLVPRLPRLRESHPHFHLDIDTRPHALARLDDGLDAAIVLVREVEEAYYSRRLSGNRVVAIGSREMMEGDRALRSPADLARATILLHRDLPDAFDYWREAVGLPGLEPAAVDMFDSGQLILDAAAETLGVAIMFEMHLDANHDPRLVRLFDVAAPTPYHYFFACRRSSLHRPPVRLFHDWLVEELG